MVGEPQEGTYGIRKGKVSRIVLLFPNGRAQKNRKDSLLLALFVQYAALLKREIAKKPYTPVEISKWAQNEKGFAGGGGGGI